MPDADFRSTAGRYNAYQFMVERNIFCFRSGISVVPHIPLHPILPHDKELIGFLRNLNRLDPSLSYDFEELQHRLEMYWHYVGLPETLT